MLLVIGPSPLFPVHTPIPRGVAAGVAVDRIASAIDGAVDVHGHAVGAGLAHLFTRRHPHKVKRLVLSSFGLATRTHLLSARLRSIVDDDAALFVDLFAFEEEYGMRDPVFMPGRVMLVFDDDTARVEQEDLAATYPGARLTRDMGAVSGFLGYASGVVSLSEPR